MPLDEKLTGAKTFPATHSKRQTGESNTAEDALAPTAETTAPWHTQSGSESTGLHGSDAGSPSSPQLSVQQHELSAAPSAACITAGQDGLPHTAAPRPKQKKGQANIAAMVIQDGRVANIDSATW